MNEKLSDADMALALVHWMAKGCMKIILITLCLSIPVQVLASSGSGSMGAEIFHTRNMSLGEVKAFCKENAHAVQCDIMREHVEGHKEVEYDVLSMHVE